MGWQGPNRPFRIPGQARIWVRVDGAWRAGDVHRWILGVDPPTWLAWASYAVPGLGHPHWGLFVYEPATIRQRFDDRLPDNAAGPR